METTKVYIWHDANGKIIGVGRPMRPNAENIIPVAKHETHGVMILDVQDHLINSLHQTHKIDVKSGYLVAHKAE